MNKEQKVKKPKYHMKWKAKRTIFIIVMLIYPLSQFALFWGYVNFDSIVMTFRNFSWEQGRDVFVGFQNYRSVFDNLKNNEDTRRIILNSLLYMPINNLIILPLSLTFSYFLYKKIPLSGFFRVVYFLPSILPIVVLTMAYKFVFDPNLGPINDILKDLFNLHSSQIPTWFGEYPTNQIMIFVYGIWVGLGFNILILSGAISRIPIEIIEYGQLEGIGLFQELRHVVIPLVWPTITTTFILGFTTIFTQLLQPLLLTPGSAYTYTIGRMIYEAVQSQRGLNYIATFGLVISLIGTPIIMLIRKGMNSIYADVDY